MWRGRRRRGLAFVLTMQILLSKSELLQNTYEEARVSPPKRSRRWLVPLVVAIAAAGLAGIATTPSDASTPVHEILSQVSTAAGPLFTATNHLVDGANPNAGEYLVVWAGDVNVADNTVNQLVQKATSVGLNL